MVGPDPAQPRLDGRLVGLLRQGAAGLVEGRLVVLEQRQRGHGVGCHLFAEAVVLLRVLEADAHAAGGVQLEALVAQAAQMAGGFTYAPTTVFIL